MKELLPFGDWVGLATLLVALGATIWAAYYSISKAGRQKIAEARLAWNERFERLSVELYRIFHELDVLEDVNISRQKKAFDPSKRNIRRNSYNG